MDADYVDTRSAKKKSKVLGKLKKNSKFAEALQKKKPVFDPSRCRMIYVFFFVFVKSLLLETFLFLLLGFSKQFCFFKVDTPGFPVNFTPEPLRDSQKFPTF